MVTPGRIIGDFAVLHRRRAHVHRLNLADDGDFWAFVLILFHDGIVHLGFDPDAINPPFDRSGQPLVEDAYRLTPLVAAGMWGVQCPVCEGYNVARRLNPLHLCYTCIGDGSPQFVGVDWPGEIADIEAALLARPNAVNRNWNGHLGETLEDIRQENREHGIGVAR